MEPNPYLHGASDRYDVSTPKHSGLGIASFAVSLITGIVLFLLIAAAGVIEASTPGGMDEESPIAVLLGLAILGSVFAAFVGLVLGIAGLVQGDRKKIFAVLGTVFSLLVVLGTVGIILIGLAAG